MLDPDSPELDPLTGMPMGMEEESPADAMLSMQPQQQLISYTPNNNGDFSDFFVHHMGAALGAAGCPNPMTAPASMGSGMGIDMGNGIGASMGNGIGNGVGGASGAVGGNARNADPVETAEIHDFKDAFDGLHIKAIFDDEEPMHPAHFPAVTIKEQSSSSPPHTSMASTPSISTSGGPVPAARGKGASSGQVLIPTVAAAGPPKAGFVQDGIAGLPAITVGAAA